MIRRPPRPTRTDTLFPYPPLFRSPLHSSDGTCPIRRPVRAGPSVSSDDARHETASVAHLLQRSFGPLREPDHGSEDQDQDRRHRIEVVGGEHHSLHIDHSREGGEPRSEEHTSELQSLMRISYAVFCLKKKKK